MKSIRKVSVLFFALIFVAGTIGCAGLYPHRVEYTVKKQHFQSPDGYASVHVQEWQEELQRL